LTRLNSGGISVDLPNGWEGTIGRAEALAPQGGVQVRQPTVGHFANFPLPARRADFGAEAVEVMRSGDVFVVLFEYGPESVGKALFAHQGVPRIASADFDRNALQHAIAGQSGLQRFFTVNGRPFCVYVVMGSHIDRADSVPAVNSLLASLEIG
jgi:hypothetical protein